ncbi:hypothetical protein CLV58_106279 [Spirosoma oryzae]|uniref:Uncharacterized protein n=1 Tax=Spirosoma oryzae TaxID=1469603 RepID=A0A2T0T601_9BACT|nr:hypothetical protein [Spirosoma oryzae]PRY41092.1 hypothetical protein CLV58_106279 [Spirosoma oryzae]
METQNLWPDFAVEPVKSPKDILKEQANHLIHKTNNVLSAEVETVDFPTREIVHTFSIIAPALSNYRYKLLAIEHGAFVYPVNISWANGNVEAKNQQQFIDILSNIFSEPETVRVISSLLAQSLTE